VTYGSNENCVENENAPERANWGLFKSTVEKVPLRAGSELQRPETGQPSIQLKLLQRMFFIERKEEDVIQRHTMKKSTTTTSQIDPRMEQRTT
jgi:hypothetical protein